jgi:enamine deaminase RidA (YjgF/YER057c/UK114 family)
MIHFSHVVGSNCSKERASRPADAPPRQILAAANANCCHSVDSGDPKGASRMKIVLACMSALALSAAAQAAPPKRVANGEFPIASSVEVPAGSRLVFVSGTVPEAIDAAAPAGSVQRYGDTEAQTRSILTKIDAELKKHGLSLADVVMMRVFLVAPPGQERMDFAGMMRGYSAFFGTEQQPNRPARSTIEVAGLVDPGWLVEIEVTAAQ